MKANTPARRDRIQKLVGNRFSGSAVVFIDAEDGALAFRIRAASGRYRSSVIKLLSRHANTKLNQAWLEKQLNLNGGPKAPVARKSAR